MEETKEMDLQNLFLNYTKKNKIVVQVYLENGFQMRGKIIGFDNFIIILESENKQNMIYKHAVSTIIPSEAIKISE
ncbi:MAG: RNA chaperone Hfq [Oscillospiraceae bacterium]|nr:RNA chaperone Hfq [Oscillospiraceae bacterium]